MWNLNIRCGENETCLLHSEQLFIWSRSDYAMLRDCDAKSIQVLTSYYKIYLWTCATHFPLNGFPTEGTVQRQFGINMQVGSSLIAPFVWALSFAKGRAEGCVIFKANMRDLRQSGESQRGGIRDTSLRCSDNDNDSLSPRLFIQQQTICEATECLCRDCQAMMAGPCSMQLCRRNTKVTHVWIKGDGSVKKLKSSSI